MVSVDNLLYVNSFPTVLSKVAAWEGYPDTVLFDRNGLVDLFDVGQPLVLYRNGAEQDNVRVRAVTSELKWVCRSRSDRILTIIA